MDWALFGFLAAAATLAAMVIAEFVAPVARAVRDRLVYWIEPKDPAWRAWHDAQEARESERR